LGTRFFAVQAGKEGRLAIRSPSIAEHGAQARFVDGDTSRPPIARAAASSLLNPRVCPGSKRRFDVGIRNIQPPGQTPFLSPDRREGFPQLNLRSGQRGKF